MSQQHDTWSHPSRKEKSLFIPLPLCPHSKGCRLFSLVGGVNRVGWCHSSMTLCHSTSCRSPLCLLSLCHSVVLSRREKSLFIPLPLCPHSKGCRLFSLVGGVNRVGWCHSSMTLCRSTSCRSLPLCHSVLSRREKSLFIPLPLCPHSKGCRLFSLVGGVIGVPYACKETHTHTALHRLREGDTHLTHAEGDGDRERHTRTPCTGRERERESSRRHRQKYSSHRRKRRHRRRQKDTLLKHTHTLLT